MTTHDDSRTQRTREERLVLETLRTLRENPTTMGVLAAVMDRKITSWQGAVLLTAPPTLARALSDSASTLVIAVTLAVLSLCSLPWGRDTGYGGAALLAVALGLLVSPVALWQVRAHTWRAATMRVLGELSADTTDTTRTS